MLKSLIEAKQRSKGTEEVWTSSGGGETMDWGILRFVNWSADKTESGLGAPIPFGCLNSNPLPNAPQNCAAACFTSMNILPERYPILSATLVISAGSAGLIQTTEMLSCVALTRFSNSHYWYGLINQNAGVCHKSPSVTQRPVINLRTDFVVTCRHPWFPQSTEGNHSDWKVMGENGVSDRAVRVRLFPMCLWQLPFLQALFWALSSTCSLTPALLWPCSTKHVVIIPTLPYAESRKSLLPKAILYTFQISFTVIALN